MTATALSGLRDVDDVHGSFVLTADGTLLLRDLPGVFRDDLFTDAGPRLVRLRETLESGGPGLTQLVLRFSEHKLHVRAVGTLLLCILTGAKVNGPALRMATNLVAKRVETELADGEATRRSSVNPDPSPASTASLAPTAAPAPAPAAPEAVPATRRAVLYRGRRPA